MRFHIILAFFMLFFPIIFGWGGVTCKAIRGEWFCSSTLYSVERPWDYGTSLTSWHCSRVPSNNLTTSCGFIDVPWKKERSYCCGHDEEGNCDCTAWECVSDGSRRFSITSISSPSLGYSYGAWDVAKFDIVIDQLELESVSQTRTGSFVTDYENDTKIKGYVSDAWLESIIAKNLSAGCRASPAYSSILGRISYYNAYSGYEDITYERYRDLVAPGGQKLYSSHGACSEASYEPVPANAAECRNYPLQWMKTVDSALNALELSFDKAGGKTDDAGDIYGDLKKKGVCDEQYAWGPRDACVKMQNAFATIDSKDSSTRSYGRWNRALSLLGTFKNSSWQHPPDMRDYPEMMELLWQEGEGFIPLASELIADGENATEEAENIYQSYIDDAGGYKGTVDGKYAKMKSNELSKITESLLMFELEEDGFGSIAERFSAFEEEKGEAETAYSNALSLHSNMAQQSYLRLATENAADAASSYEELAGSADGIVEDAQEVVDEKRSEAQAVLNQAASLASTDPTNTRARQYYQTALNYFNAGEGTGILGRKYENYAKALSYAWMALGEKGALENDTSSLIAQAEDLLRRAKMDEINVATEQELLSYLKSAQGGTDISMELQSIISSVLKKADLKYGHLLDTRSELLANISASADCGADLKTTMENAERGIVSGNRIDYMNGIGRLSGLEADYGEIAVELSLCEENILSNSLVASDSLMVGRIKIDRTSDAALTVLITNPTQRSGQNVPVNIVLDSPLQLLYSDAREGSDYISNVLSEGNALTILLKEVKPYRTYSIRFEKAAVLATTTSLDSYAKGTGDGNVRVEERRTFRLDADNVYIDIPIPEKASIVSADIDGKSADAAFNSGSHTLSAVYLVRDAYSQDKTDIDAMQIGTNTQLSYRITIMPRIDLDELPLTVTMDYPEVSAVTITAVYGATMGEKECEGNVCNINLLDLKSGEEAEVSVSYIIIGTTAADTAPVIPGDEYCIAGVNKKCDPLPSDINQTIAMINAANERGDFAAAVELREKLKNDIDAWMRNQQSMADEYIELLAYLQAEKEEITTALGKTGSLNVSLVSDLKTRETELGNTLANAESAETISGALTSLRSVDKNWLADRILAYRTDSWDDYNDLKKRLFEAGVTAMPSEFLQVEKEIKELEGSGSPVDAVELAKSLDAAEKLVEAEEAKASQKTDDLLAVFQEIKEGIASLIGNYNEQHDAAKGTEWEGLFTADSSDINKLVNEIDSMFGKEDSRLIEKKTELLEKKKEKLEGILEQLKEEATRVLQTASVSFEAKKDQMAGDVRNSVGNGIALMSNALASGDYISALKTGKIVLRELGNYPEDGGVNIFLLILAIIAVGAAAALYLIKKRGGLEGELKLPFLEKKEKPVRRLERAEQ